MDNCYSCADVQLLFKLLKFLVYVNFKVYQPNNLEFQKKSNLKGFKTINLFNE